MDSWTPERLETFFQSFFNLCTAKMLQKNKLYGNSWYQDRTTTLTDTIRHKIDRIRSLEEFGDDVNESIEDNLLDIANYVVFRIIKERELHDKG